MVKKAIQATPNVLLRAARRERGWTQRDVADRIGAPLALNVTRWERGTARPRPHYVAQLCRLFGKTASQLGLLSLEEVVTPSSSLHTLLSGDLLSSSLFCVPGGEEWLQLQQRTTWNQQSGWLLVPGGASHLSLLVYFTAPTEKGDSAETSPPG